MISNNLKALSWYGFLRFLTFFSDFFIGFDSSLPKSKQEGIDRISFQQSKTLITFIVVIILYYIFARIFLKDQGSRVKNIISVSLIFVLGLFLNIMMSLGYYNFGPINFLYGKSTFSITYFTSLSKYGLLIQLTYMLIPCLFMGLAIRKTKLIE
jgi:hypothetical protein